MHRRSFLTSSAAGLAMMPATRLLAAGNRRGTFLGAGGHATTGTVQVAGDRIDLLADFTFDGAPDPKVGLGRGGFDPRTLMGSLKSAKGASSYAVPAGVDASAYDEVWIWCEQYDVPLGVAKLV